MIGIIIAQLRKSEKWKLYVWGHAFGHVSDWSGCNYRIASLPTQPFRGFETKQEAIKFLEQSHLEQLIGEAGEGRFFNDDVAEKKFIEWDTVKIKK